MEFDLSSLEGLQLNKTAKKQCKIVLLLECIRLTSEELEKGIIDIAKCAPDIALYCIWLLQHRLMILGPTFSNDFILELISSTVSVHYFTKFLCADIENREGRFLDDLGQFIPQIIEHGDVRDALQVLNVYKNNIEDSEEIPGIFLELCKKSLETSHTDLLLCIENIQAIFEDPDQQLACYGDILEVVDQELYPPIFGLIVQNSSLPASSITRVFRHLPITMETLTTYLWNE